MKIEFLKNGVPALLLAPMEGVTDFPMRALLTELGGFQYCVSEFVRVTQEPVPEKVFYRLIPELRSGGRTASGIPIIVQLLGGDSQKIAESALTAVKCGALGIDLNFGCPAPTVNRHDGGAVLLKSPSRIFEIVSAVRRVVPANIPVSAKLRLGWERIEEIYQTSDAAIKGGANWLTIHARTRSQGYAPPVHWNILKEIKKIAPVPIVANGDIRTLQDFKECREVTGCEHFMLGRGALAEPALAQGIALELGLGGTLKDQHFYYRMSQERWLPLFKRFVELAEPQAQNPLYTAKRIKQWLSLAGRCYSIDWAEPIKRASSLEEMWEVFCCEKKEVAL